MKKIKLSTDIDLKNLGPRKTHLYHPLHELTPIDNMSWFKKLFGIEEPIGENINGLLYLENGRLFSSKSDQSYGVGQFTTPTLSSLRQTALANLSKLQDHYGWIPSIIHEGHDDIFTEHSKPENKGALFQAASQMNCLEFSSPKSIPEMGVTIYQYDNTQGPACAIATGPGTVYRNYFTLVDGIKGQTKDRQINCLDLLETAVNDIVVYVNYDGTPIQLDPTDSTYGIGNQVKIDAYKKVYRMLTKPMDKYMKINITSHAETYNFWFNITSDGRIFYMTEDNRCVFMHHKTLNFWSVKNGYVKSTHSRLEQLSAYLESQSSEIIYQLRDLIKVGFHQNVEVVFGSRYNLLPSDKRQTVSQVYCSALPVGYSSVHPDLWEPFARLVLEAMYEATMWSAVINAIETGNNRVIITAVGGGVFGNRQQWIADAINRAIRIMKEHKIPLKIVVSHYKNINPEFKKLIKY